MGGLVTVAPHTSHSRLSTYILTSSLKIVSSSKFSLTVRFDHFFSKHPRGTFSCLCTTPKDSPIGQTFQSLRDPMALSPGHFPVRTLSLGDSYHQAGPFFLPVEDSATHQLIPVTGSLLGLS